MMGLTALQHSAFLQALGAALANNIWQVGILWVCFHLLWGGHKNGSARFKYNISTAFLFSAFLWFLITFIEKYLIYGCTIDPLETQSLGRSVNSSIPGTSGFRYLLYLAFKILPYLSIAYILLLIAYGIKFFNSFAHLLFIKNHGLHTPPTDWLLFNEIKISEMGLSKKVALWLSDHVDVPATIGYFKPLILIPLATVNGLTTAQLEAVILHELSHIKRNDYLVNLIVNFIETILFFNPFIFLFGQIIRKEREDCCDDLVLEYKYDRYSYASALLSLEHSRKHSIQLALAATSNKNQLLGRIKRIMGVKRSNDNINYGKKIIALLLVTGIICLVAWLVPENSIGKTPMSNKINSDLPLESPRTPYKHISTWLTKTTKASPVINRLIGGLIKGGESLSLHHGRKLIQLKEQDRFRNISENSYPELPNNPNLEGYRPYPSETITSQSIVSDKAAQIDFPEIIEFQKSLKQSIIVRSKASDIKEFRTNFENLQNNFNHEELEKMKNEIFTSIKHLSEMKAKEFENIKVNITSIENLLRLTRKKYEQNVLRNNKINNHELIDLIRDDTSGERMVYKTLLYNQINTISSFNINHTGLSSGVKIIVGYPPLSQTQIVKPKKSRPLLVTSKRIQINVIVKNKFYQKLPQEPVVNFNNLEFRVFSLSRPQVIPNKHLAEISNEVRVNEATFSD